METENSTLNNEVVQQGSAATAVVEESSQTTANAALAADDAAIFGSVRKQASESVDKPKTPVTTEQEDGEAEATPESKAVTKPTEGAEPTEKEETAEPTDAEIDAMPEEIRGKARRERQYNRLLSKVKAAEQAAATERKQREEIERQVREQVTKGAANQSQPIQPSMPHEIMQARAATFQKWNEIIAAVQQGTKSEADAVPVWAEVQAVLKQEGAWEAEQKLQAAQRQQSVVAQVERERTDALNTLADLTGDDPRFDMTDDIADANRRANPQTPFGKLVHDLCMRQYQRPVQTWAELEGFALKASRLIQRGQAQLAVNKAKIAENQSRSLVNRIGLESSTRHAPPPRSVSTDNSDLRNRLASDDPKVVKQARYELFESEAKAHGLA